MNTLRRLRRQMDIIVSEVQSLLPLSGIQSSVGKEDGYKNTLDLGVYTTPCLKNTLAIISHMKLTQLSLVLFSMVHYATNFT